MQSAQVPPSPRQDTTDTLWIPLPLAPDDRSETCSLVLSAVEIEHLLDHGRILVPSSLYQTALEQLDSFRRENRNWPPASNETQEHFSVLRPPTLLMFCALALFHWITGPWRDTSPWFAAGAVNSSLILEQHQWWRLVTGLTLHADLQHLAGNCLIGGLMVHLLCRVTGYGTAWLALILVGAGGNLLNIWLRGGPHLSVGFSTAVFAAIGMFSGLQAGRRRPALAGFLIPVGAGLALLAFLGTEGARTDLGAHLAGFCGGIPVGIFLRHSGLTRLRDHTGLQNLLMAAALVIVGTAWRLAAAHGHLPLR